MTAIRQVPEIVSLEWVSTDSFVEQITMREINNAPVDLVGATVSALLRFPGSTFTKALTVTTTGAGSVAISAPANTVKPGVYRWRLSISRPGSTRSPVEGTATVHG